MKISFLPGAEEDLKDLRRYVLRAFGEAAWQESYRRIKETARLLQQAPAGGTCGLSWPADSCGLAADRRIDIGERPSQDHLSALWGATCPRQGSLLPPIMIGLRVVTLLPAWESGHQA